MVIYYTNDYYKSPEILEQLYPGIILDSISRTNTYSKHISGLRDKLFGSPSGYKSIIMMDNGVFRVCSPYQFWNYSAQKNVKYLDDAALKSAIKMAGSSDPHTRILGYDFLSTLEPHIYFYIFCFLLVNYGKYDGTNAYAQFIYNTLFDHANSITIQLMLNKKRSETYNIMPVPESANYMKLLDTLK